MLQRKPTWEAELDQIKIQGLAIDCVVGIYPREALVVQRLELDLTLYLDTREAVRCHSLTKSVDYAALSAEVTFILQNAHFKLLETAAEAVCHYILSPSPVDRSRGQVIGAEVTLKKPKAMAKSSENCAVPSLTIKRHRSEISGRFQKMPMGEVYTIHSSPDCHLFRLEVPPCGSFDAYSHTGGIAVDMPYSPGLELYGQELNQGVALLYPEGFIRHYTNKTSQTRTILSLAQSGVDFVLHEQEAMVMHQSRISEKIQKSYYDITGSGGLYF